MYGRHYIIKILLTFLLSLVSTEVCAITLWSETFETYADGSTVAVDNNTNDVGADWSLTNGVVTGTFSTQSSNAIFGGMSFSANRADADAVNGSIWTSEIVDVSTYGTIEIGITFEEKGNLEITDWIDIEYNKNGSGWVNMSGGQQVGNFGGPTTITEILAGCTTIQIRVKAYTDANGEQIIFDNVYVEAIVPLPIEMSELKYKNGFLQWITYSEINSSHFEIMISDSGIDYETIGFIHANGYSTIPILYEFPIEGLGVKYIKLKKVDLDGTFEFTEVLFISEPPKKIDISIIPNPNNGFFLMQIPYLEEDVILILYNTTGQELWSKVIIKEYQYGLVAFDLKGKIPSGIYYIIGTSKNYLINKRIIVQD